MKKYTPWIALFTLFLLLFVGLTCRKAAQLPIDRTPIGLKVPEDIYVIIEIPAHSDPIKYEMDKKSGLLFVDRFIDTELRYPVNYGYIPHTLSGDGDPADVLVITPYPVISGAVVHARPLALLIMEDEAGQDAKILAVPVDKLSTQYSQIQTEADLDPKLLLEIEHFFKNYKNAEPGKWVKLKGWKDKKAAEHEILESIERFEKSL